MATLQELATSHGARFHFSTPVQTVSYDASGRATGVLLENGQPAHLSDHYLPPKKPYSFTRMLDDILNFSAERLVDNGRLCMWMPVADATVSDTSEAQGEQIAVYDVPLHPQRLVAFPNQSAQHDCER